MSPCFGTYFHAQSGLACSMCPDKRALPLIAEISSPCDLHHFALMTQLYHAPSRLLGAFAGPPPSLKQSDASWSISISILRCVISFLEESILKYGVCSLHACLPPCIFSSMGAWYIPARLAKRRHKMSRSLRMEYGLIVPEVSGKVACRNSLRREGILRTQVSR